MWIVEGRDPGLDPVFGERIGRVTPDGRVAWVRQLPISMAAVGRAPAGLWIERGDAVLFLADSAATAHESYTWRPGIDTDGNCETRVPVTAPDGSVWLVACNTAVHLLNDGSAVAVPVPHCFAWSGTVDPSNRLLLTCDNRVVTLTGTAVTTERWDDAFDARKSLFSVPMAVTADGALWIANQPWHGSLLRRPPVGDSVPTPLSPALPFSARAGRFVGVAVDGAGVAWLGSRQGLARLDRTGGLTITPVKDGVADVSVAAGNVWFLSGLHAAGVRKAGATRIVLRTSRRSGLAGIAASTDGGAWVTDAGRRRIGHITASGHVTWRARGLAHVGGLIGISAAAGGGASFAAQSGWVGRIDRHGRIRIRRTRPGANPVDVATGPDGAVWFTEFGRHRVGRWTGGGAIHEYDLGFALDPTTIVAGADGAMWTLTASEYPNSVDTGIARITGTGRVTPFYVRQTKVTPAFGLAAAPDGTLLFALDGGPAALGRFDPWRDPTLGPTLPPRPPGT
jgi:virginiamycin B lyase